MIAHPDSYPALKALIATQSAGPLIRTSSEQLLKDSLKHYNHAALNHLVILGLKSQDPLLTKCWEHYATVDESARTLYAQGWGLFQGDLGYLESDRNPFLHSRNIKIAPFETVLIKLSGTSEAGVLAAVAAARGGLLNGIVPVGKWQRPEQTLLDLDPVVAAPALSLAKTLHTPEGSALLAGFSQAPANEYRAILNTTGTEPSGVWRYKYLVPKAFDDVAIRGWMSGLHRMAFGNAVTVIAFANDKEAAAATLKIGAHWKKIALAPGQTAWQGQQPKDELMPEPLGTMTTWSHGRYVLLSSLPTAQLSELLAAPVMVK